MTLDQTSDEVAPKSSRRELISFSVGGQDFCMDIMSVREIRGWSTITPLPHSARDVLGVINLRGAVVPIVDLSDRLGLGQFDPGPRDVIIISVIGSQTVGFVVGGVSDIINVQEKEIHPGPKGGGPVSGRVISGIVSAEGATLRIINTDFLVPRAGEA